MSVLKSLSVILMLSGYLFFSAGCTSLNPFPMSARAGDTITLGLGYDGINYHRERMDISNTTINIIDNPLVPPDLTYTATVEARSVLNLYPDPRSFMANFHPELINAALNGDPFETVIVMDLPPDIPAGSYLVKVTSPYCTLHKYRLEVIDSPSGPGSIDDFFDNLGIDRGSEISYLERGPVTTVHFASGYTVGAVSLVIDFDQTAVPASDINIHQPRKVFGPGSFQSYQRLLSWSDNGDTITVNILCPRGVSSQDLDFELLYQAGPNPNFSILSTKVYDLNGNALTGVTATLN